MSKYPKALSRGENNEVVALSDAEVAKIFTGDTRSDIGSEAEKMQFANRVNGLVVGFRRLDLDEENDREMLVMERLYPLDYRAWEVEKRELAFEVFADELHQLHRHGFVHRDLFRPKQHDNVSLTERDLRLIDTGISALREKVGERLFSKYVEVELAEVADFKKFFLSR